MKDYLRSRSPTPDNSVPYCLEMEGADVDYILKLVSYEGRLYTNPHNSYVLASMLNLSIFSWLLLIRTAFFLAR